MVYGLEVLIANGYYLKKDPGTVHAKLKFPFRIRRTLVVLSVM